jgi:signal transduction histidine kinase
MSLEKESVNMGEILKGIKDLAADWARKGKVEISLSCPKAIGEIDIDSRRIKQALMNLIRNSINFTPSGGRIDISAKRKKEGIEIKVSDTGIGISREHQARIFEPFEKAQRGKPMSLPAAEATANSKGGAGLGLSLVKNIISMHGGSVDLKSETDIGTTVTIFLPFEAEIQAVRPIKMKKALSFR